MTSTLNRKEATPAAERSTTPVPLKRRVSRQWLAAAGVLILLGAGATWAAFNSASSTTGVVAVVTDVNRGDTIDQSDLGVLEVGDGAAQYYLPVASIDDIVGQTALTDLAAYTPLTSASIGDLEVVAGSALVGIPLTPGQIPSHGVHAGATVSVVATASVDAAATDADPVSITAEVFAVRFDDTTGVYLVDLLLRPADAERVAAIAATGNIALIVTGDGS